MDISGNENKSDSSVYVDLNADDQEQLPSEIESLCMNCHETDLNRQIVKSEYATVSLPELEFEIPAGEHTGEITTLEGIILRAKSSLAEVTEDRQVSKDVKEKLITFVDKLSQLINCETEFSMIIDDPSGNSFIENPHPEKIDTQLTTIHYHRSLQQEKLLGLVADDVEESNDEDAPPVWESREAIRNEVIIMATCCEHCGHRTNEVKSASGIAERGIKLTLHVVDTCDLTRDILKSENCFLYIPELELEVGMGIVGSKFTTVEGLLKSLKETFENQSCFSLGDSASPDQQQRMRSFLEKLDQASQGKFAYHLIFDDPSGNSYIESLTAPNPDSKLKVEFYERSWEQNEELGLNDMNTENYSSEVNTYCFTSKMVQSRVDNSEKCVKMVNTCVLDNFGSKVMFVPMNDQIHELHTIIRDKCTSQGDFVFYSDRLIRLVLEESLNLLPYSPWTVVSPTGFSYDGLRFSSGNCSVSIIRSGGVMEKGLRECCRSMRIGKILIQKDADSGEVKVVYSKLVQDIQRRHVLLLYPIMNTGKTVHKAMQVLIDNEVKPCNVILVNLFCTPSSLHYLSDVMPELSIVTSECSLDPPNYFCTKYFGQRSGEEPSGRPTMRWKKNVLVDRRRCRRTSILYRQVHASRERSRVESFNRAFEQLRRLLPTLPPDKKLTKIEILRLAISYMTYLDCILML
ncbi:Zinc finger protein ZPR1 [Trichinella patagoniensis]|uniref:uracil phosphoribosyltransferase n=1 Tax=Trichinella patagoniensis TaxID=990121 RepID=A0A0V0ZRM6_9BILA|nr:Zinc finger protein ZPR1 [Trichinella patagoniensis]